MKKQKLVEKSQNTGKEGIMFRLVILILSFLCIFPNLAFSQVGLDVFTEKVDFGVERMDWIPGNDGCRLGVVIYGKATSHSRAFFNESHYQQNIPIAWIYKDGVKIKEVKLIDFDPNKRILNRGELYDTIWLESLQMPILKFGEHARFLVKIDPLNKITEKEFYKDREDETIKSYENNNEIEKTFGCQDFVLLNKECPSSQVIFPGSTVKVSGYAANYYNNAHSVVIDLFLSTDTVDSKNHPESTFFKEDMRLAYTTLDISPHSQQEFTLNGKIPSDTPSGRYYLGVALLHMYADREANTKNNIFWCPIVLQPTAQQRLGEEALKREPSVPREAQKVAEASLPDLTITGVEQKQDCRIEITIKNSGAPLQESIYQSNPVILNVNEPTPLGRTLARFNLKEVDPQKALKNTNGETKFIWVIPKNMRPLDKNVRFVVDPEKKIFESNEQNNIYNWRILCPGETSGKEKK